MRVRRECFGRVAVLTMDSPPVNAFGLALRQQLYDSLLWAKRDAQVGAVVLAGNGRGFSAGGDIREFGTPAAVEAPGLSSHIHVAIERMGKPVVAMVHGLALGGGLETVMACHYRIAEEDAVLALPEVGLGTLPLSATQRLPRLMGVLPALRFMAEGHRHRAAEFTDTLLFDQVVKPTQGLVAACELAAYLAAVSFETEDLDRRLVRNRPVPGGDVENELLKASQWLQSRQPGGVELALLEAVEAAVRNEHFDSGLDMARQLFDQLMAGDDIRRARDQFLATPPGRSAQPDPNEIG